MVDNAQERQGPKPLLARADIPDDLGERRARALDLRELGEAGRIAETGGSDRGLYGCESLAAENSLLQQRLDRLEEAMIILHQRMRAKPDRCDEVTAALDAIVPGARATEGVFKLDIARDLLDPSLFIATGVYENGHALERQESAAEVHQAMAMFPDALAAPPERTIYDASVDPALV